MRFWGFQKINLVQYLALFLVGILGCADNTLVKPLDTPYFPQSCPIENNLHFNLKDLEDHPIYLTNVYFDRPVQSPLLSNILGPFNIEIFRIKRAGEFTEYYGFRVWENGRSYKQSLGFEKCKNASQKLFKKIGVHNDTIKIFSSELMLFEDREEVKSSLFIELNGTRVQQITLNIPDYTLSQEEEKELQWTGKSRQTCITGAELLKESPQIISCD